MTMKNILHNISDKSDAEQSNLWLAIEEQMIEEKLMKKSKNRLYRLSLTWLVALLGLLIVASIAFGQNVQRTYHPVTLADIEVLANPVNMIETNDGFTIQVDWSYADTTQIIFAYTVLDENSNALIGHDIGRGELKYFGDAGNRILPLVHNPNETQQVVRISRGFLFGMDLTTIALRNFMTSFGEGSSSVSILAELELPVREPLFDYDVELPEFDFTGQSSPGFTDVNVYFSDLTIDDISTTVLLCMALPDDAIPASYFPDVNLFVDGRAVTDVLITEAVPDNAITFDSEIIAYRTDHQMKLPGIDCSSYTWFMRFDTLPDSIRVEIPELRATNLYGSGFITRTDEEFAFSFENAEHLQAYIDLMTAQGYDLTMPEDGILRNENYPPSWYDLDLETRNMLNVWNRIVLYSQFNHETPYTQGWEYTFEINSD